MRQPYYFILIGVLFSVMLTAQENKPVFSGFIRNYTGILTKDMDQFSILQNTFTCGYQAGRQDGYLKQIKYFCRGPRYFFTPSQREGDSYDFSCFGRYSAHRIPAQVIKTITQ